MKQSPLTIPPSAFRARQPQKMTSCVEAGPGSRLVVAIASSSSALVNQRLRSTQSSRTRAMCAGGPPKPVQPMRVQAAISSRSDACSFTGGCDADSPLAGIRIEQGRS